MTKLETELKITPADLPSGEDLGTLVVHKSETTRTALALSWLKNKAVNTAEQIKQYYLQINWWGTGERARQKIEQFEKIEEERQDVEDLFEEIVVHHNQSWIDTSENLLGDIEIRLLEQEDIHVKLLDEPEDSGSKYMKEQAQLLEAQEEAIHILYSTRKLNTPINLKNHVVQTQVGQNGYWSCAAVSSLNALRALNIATTLDSEASIIQELGGPEAFSDNGYLPMGKIYDFLLKRDLFFRPTGNILELMQTLENGGVAIIAFGGHARLISGAYTQDNQVHFRINDPLIPGITSLSSSELVSKINKTKRFYNMYLIEKN